MELHEHLCDRRVMCVCERRSGLDRLLKVYRRQGGLGAR